MTSTHQKKLDNYIKLIQLADTFQDSNMKLKILNNIEADVRAKIIKTSDYDIPYFVTNNYKISKVYKWRPKKNIDQTINDIYKWLIINKKVRKFFL